MTEVYPWSPVDAEVVRRLAVLTEKVIRLIPGEPWAVAWADQLQAAWDAGEVAFRMGNEGGEPVVVAIVGGEILFSVRLAPLLAGLTDDEGDPRP